MAFRIATNVASINTQRWLAIAQAGMNKSLERLSSGYKINKAADDAAGSAIALKLNVKAVSLSKAIDNGNQALAMLQTAESGINEIGNILTRLKELATQAASDTVSDEERGYLNTEAGKLVQEITKIANNTKYGAVSLIDDNHTYTFQLGNLNDQDEQIGVGFVKMTAEALGVESISLATISDAQDALDTIDEAVTTLNETKASIGAAMNQISYHVANMSAMYENTMAAQSTIKDADFAKEMAEFTKYQIITQSGIAMLAQANQVPQLILSLMR
ncbi:MAG: flagellin [Deltaproteobacteria bacterium]|nr:flagellin [Deltaproteobacteria bacterium]